MCTQKVNPWKFKRKNLEAIPEDAIGFIYLITFADNTKYVGKKNFYSTRRMKVKGRKNRKVVVKESDWRTYNSSSEIVKERIKNGETHKREIIHFCDSKGALMYMEIKEMIVRSVLCDENYLNKNIFMKIFRCYKPMDMEK